MPARFLNPHSKKARRGRKRRFILLCIVLLSGLASVCLTLRSKFSVVKQAQGQGLIPRLRELEDTVCKPGNTIELSDPFFRGEVENLTPFDVANAVIAASRYPGAVVDVGANKGWPVTRLALKIGGRNVYSVEPDERNFRKLRDRHFSPNAKHGNFKYTPIFGAAGKEAGKKKMMFHKKRDDFTCMNCMSLKQTSVYEKEVDIYAMQDVVDENQVCLFKTDTQGYELNVLEGSQRLFDQNKVRYLLVEFDPKLLGTRQNALALLGYLDKEGFKCAHLKCVTFEKGFSPTPFGLKIEKSSFNLFINHLSEHKSYTDLFCFRPHCSSDPKR